MSAKGRTMKQKPKNESFIRQVSKLHGDRSHIEVPKDKRDKIKPGDTVRVEKIE